MAAQPTHEVSVQPTQVLDTSYQVRGGLCQARAPKDGIIPAANVAEAPKSGFKVGINGRPPPKLCLVHPRLIPEREFNQIAYSNLSVDLA